MEEQLGYFHPWVLDSDGMCILRQPTVREIWVHAHYLARATQTDGPGIVAMRFVHSYVDMPFGKPWRQAMVKLLCYLTEEYYK
jgi:hypothetical protein